MRVWNPLHGTETRIRGSPPITEPRNNGEKRMRDTEAQVSIDFLIGILIFAGIIFFAIQFVGSTAAPFISSQTSGEKVTKVHSVGDRLYHDKLATEREGKLNLSYFQNSTGGIKNESELAVELGLVNGTTEPGDVSNITERYEMSVKVTNATGDLVSLNGSDINIGGNSPVIGGAGAKAKRVGYTETNGTVAINLEVW